MKKNAHQKEHVRDGDIDNEKKKIRNKLVQMNGNPKDNEIFRYDENKITITAFYYFLH